jgi:hypothetical protein
MRRSVAVLLSALFALVAAPALAQEPVVFGKRAPAVGEKVHETKQIDMTLGMTVKVNGKVVQTMSMQQQEVEDSTAEVLATNGSAASKIKVTYGTMQESGSQGGAPPMTQVKPIAGKTYIVERTDAGLAVTTDSGATPPPAEVELVQKEQKDLGKTDPLTDAIPAGPMAIGQQLALPPETVKAMFDDPNMTVEAVSFTLTGVRDGQAVFAVIIKITGAPNPGMTMTLDLTGEMTIQPADSLPTSMHLTGPVTMSGHQEQPGQKIEMDGSGAMTMKGTLGYSN